MKGPRASFWKRLKWMVRAKRYHWYDRVPSINPLADWWRREIARQLRIYWAGRQAEWEAEHKYWRR